MKALSYYAILPFLYLVSILPYPLLYGVSSFFYLVIFKLLGYRKKVVLANLRAAFPQKSEDEIQRICREFYKHLCDMLLENLKLLSASREQIAKRVEVDEEGQARIKKLYEEGKSLLMVMGHFGNWEFAGTAFTLKTPHKVLAIYHPLSHPYFNQLVLKIRKKIGVHPIPMATAFRDILAHRGQASATVLIADQAADKNVHWCQFLGQDTPVLLGTEKIALKLGLKVIYVSVFKLKRGRYRISYQFIDEEQLEKREGAMTEAHTQLLERDIVRQPSIWLWSHRRWKYTRKRNLEPGKEAENQS